MIINDLDLGLSHPWPAPQQGQMPGTALIEGQRTIVWTHGATVVKQDVLLWVTAWQAIGGQAAMTFQAARYLVRQLEELATNADLNPVYIQWTASAAPGAFSRQDERDGWYVIENVQPNYQKFIIAAIVECRMTVSLVAPASPAGLALGWAGAQLSTTYTGAIPPAGYVLGAYPVGSTAPTAPLNRTGAEGVVPLSVTAAATGVPQPLPFIRPNTVAALYTGGCRVLDTINTGSNPIPTSGAFLNANWVQVYGTQHDFQGDCVVTNGLLLLLFQAGQAGVQVWLWNTQLVTPAWQQAATVNYNDNAFNAGTVREITLERVGLEQVRLRITLSTSAGQWAKLVWRLRRGHYNAPIEFWPLTQANTNGFGLRLALAAAGKIAYTDAGINDIATVANATLTAGTIEGFLASFGQTARGPLVGWLYQNPPSTAAFGGGANTDLAFGDNNGPAQGTYRLYGVFAVPFNTAPNLQAEGESGSLGTGWSSVADAAASNGNAAKAASGTASGNADLFGVAWQPQPQNGNQADVWFRVKVTSAAGSAAEMTLGLWDATSGLFEASTTFRANQASTSYVWLKANATAMSITAGHNIQFRAVTAATLGTDWFIDEAVLAPSSGNATSNVGNGDWPADIWEQFSFPLTLNWVQG